MELQCYFCGQRLIDSDPKVQFMDGWAHPECNEDYLSQDIYTENKDQDAT